jgi:hypothetical protein
MDDNRQMEPSFGEGRPAVGLRGSLPALENRTGIPLLKKVQSELAEYLLRIGRTLNPN